MTFVHERNIKNLHFITDFILFLFLLGFLCFHEQNFSEGFDTLKSDSNRKRWSCGLITKYEESQCDYQELRTLHCLL